MSRATNRAIRRKHQQRQLRAASEQIADSDPLKIAAEQAKALATNAEGKVRALLQARDVLLGGTKLNGAFEEERLRFDEPQEHQHLEDVKLEIFDKIAQAKLEFAEALLDYTDAVDAFIFQGSSPQIVAPTGADVAATEASKTNDG